MNEILPEFFAENVRRLALGLEPLDAPSRERIPFPIRVTFDNAPLGLRRPPVDRHHSCLYALLFDPSFDDLVDLRFFEPPVTFGLRVWSASIRYVPRRLRIPIRTRATADAKPFTDRVRRPVLFPGPAYDVQSLATALRGRVLRNGQPMRWARVEARLTGTATVIARAHGDDHGEFLLVLGSNPVMPLLSPDDSQFDLDVEVFGPATPPVPPDPDSPFFDSLWGLPLEEPASLAAVDPVVPDDPIFAGDLQPAGYTKSVLKVVTFTLGKTSREEFSVA